MAQPLDTVGKCLKKTKNSITIRSSNPTSGSVAKRIRIDMKGFVGSQRHTCMFMFITALFIITKRWRKPKRP